MVGHVGGLSFPPVIVTAGRGVNDRVTVLFVAGAQQFLQADDEGEHQRKRRHHQSFHREKADGTEANGGQGLTHHQSHEKETRISFLSAFVSLPRLCNKQLYK